MGPQSAPKAFFVCQPEQMSFLWGWDAILWLRDILGGCLCRKPEDQSRMLLTWTPVNTRYLGVLEICLLLLAIYPGLQVDNYTANLHVADHKWHCSRKIYIFG